MWKFREVWFILLLGLFLTSNRCESRAVNISNTWTLPQEGFTVFYRFFRDQISWFEADAVCQFHHANLVTVEDSMQFDATRDFLKVLDVTELVWIGLMRAQNSKRFAWSNSKPLPSESGYWAEPLPVIESPLCAVIDPVRDFRWHALRCGGPETASFLCEMNVPSWAEECTLRDIPSLTIQYMADSGSVELSKDCGEEGTIHQICRGKQDRDRILKELVCKNERNTEINQNSITSTDLADTHYKSLQIIQNIPSDNNEDNNIREKMDKIDNNNNNDNNDDDGDNNDKKEPEQNPVQKLIEQFNVEELMQADQPQQQQLHHIPDEIRKPVKKTLKKAKSFEKKDRAAKKMKSEKVKDKKQPQDIPLEDMMMGDQPESEPNNDVKSPFLPHMKKSFPDDLLHHEVITTVTSTSETNHEPESTFAASSTELTEKSMISSAAITVPPPVETKTGTIGHPMHPQQPRMAPASANPIEESNLHPVHIKETSDNHFIPPMLLVKSHYTSTKSHSEGGDTSIHHPADLTTIKHEQTSDGIVSTSTTTTTTTTTITTIPGVTESKNHLTTQNASIVIPTSILDSSTTSTAKDIKETTDKVQAGSSSITFEPPSTEHQIVEIKIANTDSPTTTFSITTRSIPPSASETSEHGSSSSSSTMKPTEQEQNLDIAASFHHDEQRNEFPGTTKHDTNSSPAAAATGSGTITATTTTTSGEKSESKEDHHPKVKNKFSNEENFQPYKPNRRRSLTKPETTTYLKKILG